MSIHQEPVSVHDAERHWGRLSDAKHRVPNANAKVNERLTSGQRVADTVARVMGSWRFIIFQSIILFAWISLNAIGWIRHWDPYPFILLNLALSFQAAYSAPIIMMSQNRQSAIDRVSAETDYEVNVHSAVEIASIQKRLDDLTRNQWEHLLRLQQEQLDLLARIEALTADTHR